MAKELTKSFDEVTDKTALFSPDDAEAIFGLPPNTHIPVQPQGKKYWMSPDDAVAFGFDPGQMEMPAEKSGVSKTSMFSPDHEEAINMMLQTRHQAAPARKGKSLLNCLKRFK